MRDTSNHVAGSGGRAPDAVRRAFADVLDSYVDWDGESSQPRASVYGREMSSEEVCGVVWNCTDILPDRLRFSLALVSAESLPQVMTYARAARALKGLLAASSSTPASTYP